ncbi:hypothetical protein C4544_04650 [candidate division WS5 bacterium]|uniref:Uncharacterized protein n=1 Tax=candidate division WS5 bacterium TaxID=2093353 RepID=A0A419DC51_9BACT|nr:MAG: hypothetical protein C4544_04650 [candidate division WS5 bacterium]
MDKNNEQGKSNQALVDKKITKFLEELAWLLSSHSQVDFKKLPKHLTRILSGNDHKHLAGYVSENPNIHFLTGVLPRILTDDAIFASNEEIAEFSQSALGVSIKRWARLSKYEIIGHIVCRVQTLNDSQLRNIVQALERLLNGDREAQTLVERHADGKRDWNLIIQELTKHA